MSRSTLILGLSALALTAAPAFAQTTPPTSAPAQGTVKPHHMMHPAPAHKMARMDKMKHTSPDMSADQLNAKELASLQSQSSSSSTMPMPMPPKK